MIYHGDALEYICQTPDILQNILESADSVTEDSVGILKNREMREIYLLGTGSSYYAARAAHEFMEQLLGVRVIPVRPSECRKWMPFHDSKTIILGISQQGTSTGVISAMDEMRALGHTVIAVTGEYGTEITRHGEAILYIECGYEDAGATTKGYTATILTLMLFALRLSCERGTADKSEVADVLSALRRKIGEMEQCRIRSLNLCESISEQLKTSRDLILLAGDYYDRILPEIVLKFTETGRFPVRGYHTDDFMHGIYNAVSADTDFLFLWEESDAMRKLYTYYKKNGNRVFCLNEGEREPDLLHMILPLQQLFVMTSQKRGINLNIPGDPDFHKIMGSKLEKERKDL